ncbi:hypothetical protein BDW22DRAFT_1334411 [Trametopsis cervina]|nr:hypothetical protein BDW22DRAFT_1334411 [Trametopsis cervina]
MFRFKAILLALCVATTTLAAPHLAPRKDGVTGESIVHFVNTTGLIEERRTIDTEVLQFALTLEHLENTFYNEALSKFDEQAFLDAGFPSWVRGRFEQIKEHEQTHVDFLTKALGDAATKPCTYDFPYNDPKSFAALSMALESIGASAYMGAAHFLENETTLTEAASILAVESRHAAWVASAVLKGSAWDGAFETPLTPNGVYSLASQFIVSCPASNPKLPVMALPKLAIEPANPTAGQRIKFSYKHDEVKADGAKLYIAWFDGVEVQYSELGGDDMASVPEGLQGTVYGAIVKDKVSNPTDQVILTGLVMFEIGFPSYAGNP